LTLRLPLPLELRFPHRKFPLARTSSPHPGDRDVQSSTRRIIGATLPCQAEARPRPNGSSKPSIRKGGRQPWR
jgi:hypothetical protein